MAPSLADTDNGTVLLPIRNLYYKPDGNAEGFRPLLHGLLGSMMGFGSESVFKTTSIDASFHWILAACTATVVRGLQRCERRRIRDVTSTVSS